MALRPASEVFPGFDRLYLLGEPGTSRAFRADLALSIDQAFAITRAESHPDEPVRAKWSMGGRQPTDMIWTRIAAPVLVNDRVIGLLEALGARGWNTYRIELVGRDGDKVSGYRGLSVHGRCGGIDNSRSVKVMKRYPGGVFPEWRGLFFDPETWDGSELFMPAGRRVGSLLLMR